MIGTYKNQQSDKTYHGCSNIPCELLRDIQANNYKLNSWPRLFDSFQLTIHAMLLPSYLFYSKADIILPLFLCVYTVQLKCNVMIARESRIQVDDVSSPLTFVQY